MEFTSKEGSYFFLAITSSIFTFCFMFLGAKLSNWYYVFGFGCLVMGVKYWVKIKKANNSEIESCQSE